MSRSAVRIVPRSALPTLPLPARPRRRTGRPYFRRLFGIELLENRALLAADLDLTADASLAEGATIVALAAGVQDGFTPPPGTLPAVELRLHLAQPDGSPLVALAPGQDFALEVLARDLRPSAEGVFAAYLDITWDSALAAVTGPPQFSEEFANVRGGSTATPGLADEIGAVAGLDPIGAERLVFRLPLRSLGEGQLSFVGDAADGKEGSPLVYGWSRPLAASEIIYGAVAATISPPGAPAAGGGADDSVAAATTAASSAGDDSVLAASLVVQFSPFEADVAGVDAEAGAADAGSATDASSSSSVAAASSANGPLAPTAVAAEEELVTADDEAAEEASEEDLLAPILSPPKETLV